ncbi:beta-propeller domain-containing protein [Halobacillus litoralis]|uniref:beta-propeller domain-containing protein n=1 Tax=Halobacillus litoralis TaxID=45668 RepID=UPI001CD4D43E|nr:beta-propeller domain-containing protein [Halobacillus litoralis]MCA0968996.1 beta-propeller domain-containing protein [Halobacillus litoralis]
MKKWLTTCAALMVLTAVILTITLSQQGVAAENLESKQGVPVDKSWTITFSKFMDSSTFTEDSVTVVNQAGEQIPVSFQLSEDKRKLTIEPPENLYLFNESYTIKLSNDIRSVDEVPLKDEVIFSFHTTKDVPTVKDASHLQELLKESRQRNLEFARPEAAEDASGSTEGSNSSNDAGSGNTVSETNQQVEGVDEADIIKATEDYTFMVRDGNVGITSNNAPDAALVTTIKEDQFHASQLYINGDQLVVLGHGEMFDESTYKQDDMMRSIYYAGTTEARVYDISSPANPSLSKKVQLSGHYQTSRLIDDTLYIVSNQYSYFNPREEKTPDIRPFVFDSTVHEEPERLDYSAIRYFPEKAGGSFITLASLSLDDLDQKMTAESFLGHSEDVYVSKDHLYLTSTERTYKEEGQRIQLIEEFTNVQQFALEEGTVSFENEQRVPGRVLNQFSMDERNDVFSIATTTGDSWSDEVSSKNHLFTYDLSLQPLGSVEGLAEGERIYSARFIEDRAYLVTFEQVDPLFVIDLKDPQNPTVLGELKIPGFSNYLHPLGDHQVLGFGRQTELVDHPNGGDPMVRTTGLKVSLFNIEDVENPVEEDSMVLGDYGHSELNYNHKALYMHPERDLFGLPIQMMNEEDGSWFSGGYLFEVNNENGLQEKAQFQMNDNQEHPWRYSLQRMISVGDDLYAFSDQNMKAFDLSNMEMIQELEFPLPEQMR